MQVLTKKVEAYKFNELSEEAQEKVLRQFWDINVNDDFWHECTIDDCKEIAKIIGIDITHIYFRGFSSQGDGACFEGSYSYKIGSVKEIMAYAPQDKELHEIAKTLAEIQRKHFYRINATIKHRGHYYHAYCTDIDIYDTEDQYKVLDCTEEIKTVLRDFMNWIYSQLNKQYDYLTSKESIIDTINANEYDFTIDGIFPAI